MNKQRMLGASLLGAGVLLLAAGAAWAASIPVGLMVLGGLLVGASLLLEWRS